MRDENKNRLAYGLKVFALILWAMLAIVTCAGVWNFCKETFVVVCSIILFLASGVGVVVLWRRFKNEYESAIREMNKIK